MARLIDPALADMQMEYLHARERGRAWEALAIRVRGTLTCLRLIAARAPADVVGSLSAWTRDDLDAASRVLRFAGGSLLVVTLLLSMPVLYLASSWPHTYPLRLLPLLAPSALPITVPVALMLGIVYGMGGRAVSRGVTVAALLLAILCSGVMFGMAGWGIPAANRAFRVEAYPDLATLKGPNELTLGELAEQLSSSAPVYLLGRPSRRQLAAAYHLRWSASFATIALSLVALQLARRRRAPRWTIGVAVVVAYTAYLFRVHAYGALPPIAAAWLPNVVAVVVAAVLSLPSRPAQDV